MRDHKGIAIGWIAGGWVVVVTLVIRAVIPLPVKPALFEAFGANPESGAIPEQEFDAIAGPVAKDKDMTAGRILLELLGDDSVESVEAFSHVGKSGCDKHPGGGA